MINSSIYSSLDAVKARVRIYDGNGTLITTCTCEDVLSDFAVSREGVGGKFFGFGICHKLELKIIDIEREFQFYKGYYADISYGNGSSWDRCYPNFYFDEIKVDKKTGDISIVAYDKLKQAANYTFADIPSTTLRSYSLYNMLYRMKDILGVKLKDASSTTALTTLNNITVTADTPLNYEGMEDLRSVLDNLAECACAIYYLDRDEYLTYKYVCYDVDPNAFVYPKDYYEWEQEDNLVLRNVYSINELNDTLGVEVNPNGNVHQFIRENPIFALRSDTVDILTANAKQFSHHPFVLDWSSDYRLEVGDCIEIHDKDGTTTKVFILNDLVTYSGTLSEATAWEWTDNDAENEDTPINITDKINQTYAKVDKVNKEITLVTEELNGYPQKIAQLQVSIDDVVTKVSRVEQIQSEDNDAINNRLDTIAKETALKVDSEGVEIIVEEKLSQGVEKVVTSAKKYTFDDTGLNVSSSDSNINTTITEDGMRIYRAGTEVLTADNEGVKAEDLHATTFLIIGTTSRLEDRGNRTACFWIGD